MKTTVAIVSSAVIGRRAIIFGLAARSEAGPPRALAILREEINCALALFGAARLADFDHSVPELGS